MGKKDEPKVLGVHDIARLANVSIGTVDRVLHNRKGVSAATSDKINQIIKEIDYQPNLFASRLASKKKTHFAFLIPQVSKETDYWTGPLNGINKAAQELKQFGVVIDPFFFDLNVKGSFQVATDKILQNKPSAVLLAPSFIDESTAFVQKLKKHDIPFAFINSDLPVEDAVSYIGPDLYQSGYLTAQLVSFIIKEHEKILVVNISTEMQNHHHILKKEQGFRNFFNDQNLPNPIIHVNIQKTSTKDIELPLADALDDNKDVKVVFVTNSRVAAVAAFLKKNPKYRVILIGYDFLTENINYLKEDIIQFLICQRPQQQGYLGTMALYNHVMNIAEQQKTVFMPIDIITKENYRFYII